MAVQAGRAELPIVPTLVKSFSRDLATKMAGPTVKTANKAGTDAGRQFGKRFGQSTERAGTDAGKRSGLRFSTGLRTGIGPVRGIMRGFGPALAGAFGATALIAGIKSVTDEAREAAVVGRLTEARLKSTGGVANITAKQVGNLAERLSNMAGVDDELIQSSQNLLLTFTGVRNEAGKGNDIFNQSSAAILDMTAQMNNGQVTANGLKASTIQVGKALNDPIKGMGALSRVGVTFNNQQKEQIRTLVESGDKLGAQKIILGELRKEFGGSAAASADAGKRFGVFIGNLKERIGGVLLPILNRFLEFVIDKLPGALAGLGRALKPVVTGVQIFFKALADPDVTSAGAFGVIEKIASGLRGLFDLLVRGDFTRAFASIFNVAEDSPLVDTLLRIREGFISLKRFLPAIAVGLSALLVASTVAKALNAVGLAIKAIGVAVAANPLGLLALAAVAVGTALLFFFRNTEAGQKVLKTLWGVAKTLAQVFLTQIVPAVASAVGVFVRGLMPGLKSFGVVLKANVLPALKVVAIIIGVALYVALTKVLPLLLRIAGPVLGFFFKQLGQTIQWISNVVRFIGRVIAWLARWVTGTKTTGDAIRELGRRVGVFAGNMVKQWQTITRQVGNALSGLRRVTITVLSAMIRFWLRWAGNIVDAAATALGWIPGIGPKIRTAQAKFHEFARSVNDSLDRIKDKTVDVTAKTKVDPNILRVFTAAGGKVRMSKKGTRLPGYGGGDKIPVLAEGGETIVSKEDSRLPYMREAFQAAGVPGYRAGGAVGVNPLYGRSGPTAPKIGRDYTGMRDRASRVMVAATAKAAKLYEQMAGFGGLGGAGGPGGWRWQMAVLRQQFPGLQLISGYRPGAITATGNVSYHASGRAVDVPPRMDVFNWIRSVYGKRTRELIFSPAGGRQIHNGAPHMYTGITRANHWDHVHWAFDQGGWLQPGTTLATNTTGHPERVLSPREQLIDYDKLADKVANALARQTFVARMDPGHARQALKDHQRRGGVPRNQQIR